MIRYAILGLLRESSDYGYSLKRRFEAFAGGEWRLNIGQVYQTLQGLEQGGLVSEIRSSRSAPRTRRMYELTPIGHRALESWARRPPVRLDTLRNEFLIKLLLLGPDRRAEALEQLEGKERRCRAQLRELLAETRTLIAKEPLPHEDWPSWVRAIGIEEAVLYTKVQLEGVEECRERLRA